MIIKLVQWYSSTTDPSVLILKRNILKTDIVAVFQLFHFKPRPRSNYARTCDLILYFYILLVSTHNLQFFLCFLRCQQFLYIFILQLPPPALLSYGVIADTDLYIDFVRFYLNTIFSIIVKFLKSSQLFHLYMYLFINVTVDCI